MVQKQLKLYPLKKTIKGRSDNSCEIIFPYCFTQEAVHEFGTKVILSTAITTRGSKSSAARIFSLVAADTQQNQYFCTRFEYESANFRTSVLSSPTTISM